jgi:7-cyano-7-deazaguanine reductase
MAKKKSTAPAVAAERAPEPGKTRPSKGLEVFANPSPKRDFLIHIEIPEFTCVCPLTGQPDFATIILDYIPEERCVELKSLKLYMWSFRDQGAFHEAVTNQILDDLASLLAPRFARVTAKWYVRGGIFTNVIAEHRARDFKPLAAVDLSVYGAVAGARSTA